MSLDRPARPQGAVSRRIVVRGAAVTGLAVPLLASCSGGGSSDVTAAGGPSSSPRRSGGSSGGALAQTSEIPVGGGIILPDEQVVVTQPSAGEFKAFTAVCTHAQCVVSSVRTARPRQVRRLRR